MECLKKILKYLILVVILISFGMSNLYAKKYLLNGYYNPNRIIFKLSNRVFECSLMGVTVPYYNNTSKCNRQKSLAHMSNPSIGFFQNHLNLEQLYDVEIIDGYCIVKYNNINFNEKIIMSGYGIVNVKSINNQTLLDRFLYLENLAIENKMGLWNHFYDEMQCLRDISIG